MNPENVPAFLRVRLTLGHEIRADRQARPGETVDIEAAANIVGENYPNGFTQYDAVGRWRDPGTGRVVSERATVFEALVPNETGREILVAETLAARLALVFRQDAVLVSVDPAPFVSFVSAAPASIRGPVTSSRD